MQSKAPKPRPVTKPRVDLNTLLRMNSYNWPSHWRAVIYKAERVSTTDNIRVWPRNPDWEDHINGPLADWARREPPTPYLDPVEFADIDEIDRWAAISERISR